ncbi:uncharacterized protein [Nicotiana tomentosiformis]|uniref:uncharacterized protein n=1 Tax=Nicotiana tomentosiformis TaxID=4098 RepID=UPI00388C6BE4
MTFYTLEQLVKNYIREFVCLHGVPVSIISDQAEFAYNNNYYSSIRVAMYEALYGRHCRSSVGWFELGKARLLGTDWVREALEKVKLIQERLCPKQSRKKSYADRKVRDVAFMEGKNVLSEFCL